MKRDMSYSMVERRTFFEAWPKLAMLCLACPALALLMGALIGERLYFLLSAVWFAIDIPLLLIWRGFPPPRNATGSDAG